MRIKDVKVKGLFGVFDHEIPLQSAERVTIIHGPNGFGKTVILKMIASLINGKAAIFEHTPFDEFSVTLDDGSSRTVRRTVTKDTGGKPQVKLEFLIQDRTGNIAIIEPLPPREIPRQVMSQIDRSVPGPYYISGSGWSDGLRAYTLEEIIDKFPKVKEAVPREYRPGIDFALPPDLHVFFVETNRLASEAAGQDMLHRPYSSTFGQQPPEPAPPRVKQYSDDIVQRIRTVLTYYARHSQERDRTFPERLVQLLRGGYQHLPEREILGKMNTLESKRRRLISLGLLDSEGGLHDLTEDDVRRAPEALTIYVGDIEEKLRVFDDVSRRIGALVDIVNERFNYKHLRIDREGGFLFFGRSNQPIHLQDLSSGEQNELVVLYELLFRSPQSGLVLVDEPEISLHVAWQSRFLSDLISILEPTDAYAIIATHSPVIIGPRSDLAIELKGPEMQTEATVRA